MGKIDLTYINKQIAAKKAAEAQATSETQTEAQATSETQTEAQATSETQTEVEERKELFGETYEQFKSRLDKKFDVAMEAIKAMKELGI